MNEEVEKLIKEHYMLIRIHNIYIEYFVYMKTVNSLNALKDDIQNLKSRDLSTKDKEALETLTEYTEGVLFEIDQIRKTLINIWETKVEN